MMLAFAVEGSCVEPQRIGGSGRRRGSPVRRADARRPPHASQRLRPDPPIHCVALPTGTAPCLEEARTPTGRWWMKQGSTKLRFVDHPCLLPLLLSRRHPVARTGVGPRRGGAPCLRSGVHRLLQAAGAWHSGRRLCEACRRSAKRSFAVPSNPAGGPNAPHPPPARSRRRREPPARMSVANQAEVMLRGAGCSVMP